MLSPICKLTCSSSNPSLPDLRSHFHCSLCSSHADYPLYSLKTPVWSGPQEFFELANPWFLSWDVLLLILYTAASFGTWRLLFKSYLLREHFSNHSIPSNPMISSLMNLCSITVLFPSMHLTLSEFSLFTVVSCSPQKAGGGETSQS